MTSDKVSTKDKDIKNKIFGAVFIIAAIYFFLSLSSLGYVIWQAPETEKISLGWKVALIATHLLPFGFIPLTMRVFDKRAEYLISKGMNSPFAIQLGLAFIMVAIASEIGWHVQQDWFYRNDFTMLNFMFYFFLISAFALWADGFAQNRAIDLLFVATLVVASILYPIGDRLGNANFKLPIYIGLTIVSIVLTLRANKILQDWRIIFFPIFSVGVNLFFIFLLDRYEDIPSLNALFHILHDIAGTEAGVIVFTYLVYVNPFRKQGLQPTSEMVSAR